MAVSCLNDDNCILPSPITVTAGPSTYTLSAVYSTSVEGVQEVLTMVEDCKITGVTQGASCSVSYGIEATYKGVSTSTEVNTEISVASAEIGGDVREDLVGGYNVYLVITFIYAYMVAHHAQLQLHG
ncbi:Carboxylesterase family protein [Aspergillus niger]|uniref:Carboxylesterase family protein n=1 Tax=Aspergillus niger TaxID=5061 RepID=A0A505I952_ASPNG|nr:Carboxylesterase family protein [Aspergillus niger]